MMELLQRMDKKLDTSCARMDQMDVKLTQVQTKQVEMASEQTLIKTNHELNRDKGNLDTTQEKPCALRAPT